MIKKRNITQAARLFAYQAFEGTTTLQIAQESHVTEPLLYYHFKSRPEKTSEFHKVPNEKR